MSQHRKKNRKRARKRKKQLAQVYKRRKARLKQQRKKRLKQRRKNLANQHTPQRKITVEQTEPQEAPVSVEPAQAELEPERAESSGRGKCSRKRNRYRRGRGHAGKVFQRVLQTAVMCLMAWGLFLEARPKVVEELTIEAGGDLPELSEFMLRDLKHAAFESELETFVDLHKEADYKVGIMISGSRYTVSLHVVDTTAPVVATQDTRIYNDETLEPADLIRSIDDATKTTVEFAEEPDFTVPGDWELTLLVTDAGGNSTRASALVEIIADTEPPVIEGVEDLTVAMGKSISYKKNVTVTDDHSEHVTLTVDSSAVNLNKAGTYEVLYIAEDEAGNVTEVSAAVRVKAPGVQSATDEMVYAKADEILAGILTPGMSQYEKAQAIFNWVHGSIAYSDGTPKTSFVQGAYRGLFERKGDCFVYAASSKYLLNRAGITNMDIGFVNPRRIHYWNLIDLGEGWYHFDATRRADGSAFFYASDVEISAYSSAHNGSHAYDPSQYPQIQ